MACHCTGCQKMSASAFSLSAAIPRAAFVVTDGETVVGGLRGHPQHNFCPRCMNWMFSRIDGREFVNLRPTMLDDTSWCMPFIESYTSEMLPWATTGAVHSFEQFPPFEAYEGLIEEFSDWSADRKRHVRP
jgi:hypothetical protein